MTWVLVIAGAWLLVAVAAALVLGRVVREADRRENSTQSGPGTAVPGSSTAPATPGRPRAAAGGRPSSRAWQSLRHY